MIFFKNSREFFKFPTKGSFDFFEFKDSLFGFDVNSSTTITWVFIPSWMLNLVLEVEGKWISSYVFQEQALRAQCPHLLGVMVFVFPITLSSYLLKEKLRNTLYIIILKKEQNIIIKQGYYLMGQLVKKPNTYYWKAQSGSLSFKSLKNINMQQHQYLEMMFIYRAHPNPEVLHQNDCCSTHFLLQLSCLAFCLF